MKSPVVIEVGPSIDPPPVGLTALVALGTFAALLIVDLAEKDDGMATELKIGKTVWHVVELTYSMDDGTKYTGGFAYRKGRVTSFDDETACLLVHPDGRTAFAKRESLFATEEEAIAEVKRRNEGASKED